MIKMTLLHLSVSHHELAFSLSQAILPVAPIDSQMVDEATPSVVNIILKLPFVNMIIYFSSYSLHSCAGVYLPEGAL